MVSGLVRATVQMSRLVKHSSCTFNRAESGEYESYTGGTRQQVLYLFPETDLRDHPLEDVAAADGLENPRGDSLRDALQTFLYKHLALQVNSTARC